MLKNIYLFKESIYTLLFTIIIFQVTFYNYKIGLYYCNMFNISNTLTLTSISFGIALEIAIILTTLEILLANQIYKSNKI